MITVRYGGKNGRTTKLKEDPSLLVVRTGNRNAIARAPLMEASRRTLNEFAEVLRYADAGVQVLKAVVKDSGSRRDAARKVLAKDPMVEFAGRVLADECGSPVLYTENFFVKFEDDASKTAINAVLKKHGLQVKRALDYVRGGFFVEAPAGTGRAVFEIAQSMLDAPEVELCHPELIRRTRRRAVHSEQWHLKKTKIASGRTIDAHANVEAAWALTRGEGTVIAIIDDGVDLAHEEFSSPGKIVAPRDATRRTNSPTPGNGDHHGTACAGVACGEGRALASGVAPMANLMPIRLASALGSQAEADAFVWAADHGADVISCSWGPQDGDWTDPNDPVAEVPIPDSTRLAIDYAVRKGRGGKGCVITFAAGNGNESVDVDGYASYPKVMAIAACNDQGKKSAYSDFGSAVWCCFPSNHGFQSLTPGIWTTDRIGAAGYNPGHAALGDLTGNYTNDFGGTSSACPGVAGVAALVLSRNPDLRWDEVRDIIRRSCDKIDAANGKYDASGRSDWYGHGRINAATAVDLARPAQPKKVVRVEARQDVAIRDMKTSNLALAVPATAPTAAVKVTIEIEHTYIGDLRVSVIPPVALGLAPIVLHDRKGGGTDNINAAFDAINTPSLTQCVGKDLGGTWTLRVEDTERQDVGRIRAFGMEITSQ